MVTMAQSAANWCNTLANVDRTQSLTHDLHASTQLQPLCVKRQLSYYRIWNRILFWRYLREGEQTGVPGEKPREPARNGYHILEEKIQRPGRESNPNPPTLVVSSLGQERAPRLTHRATDRRHYYPTISTYCTEVHLSFRQ